MYGASTATRTTTDTMTAPTAIPWWLRTADASHRNPRFADKLGDPSSWFNSWSARSNSAAYSPRTLGLMTR